MSSLKPKKKTYKKSKLARIGALWTKTDKKGNKYMVGEIGGEKVLLFSNGYKKGEKDPSAYVYMDEDLLTKIMQRLYDARGDDAWIDEPWTADEEGPDNIIEAIGLRKELVKDMESGDDFDDFIPRNVDIGDD